MTASRVLLLSVASAAAFSVTPHRAVTHTHRHHATIRMADDQDKSPLAVLSAVPWNNLLLAFVTLDCTQRLTTSVPELFSGGAGADRYLGTALDVVFVGYGAQQLLKLAGVGKTNYYAELEGAEVGSFAREAGEAAVRGEVPTRTSDGRYEVATFAGGCFWGTELHFQRIPGVVATSVGYTQGEVEQPSYEQVCSGSTGHTEGLQLSFDPAVVSYGTLCEKLLATVDPTALNRVGNDRGTQYRHGIYTHTGAQAEAAAAAVARCQLQLGNAQVVTEVKPAEVFWPAEGYHQRYLEKNGQSAAKECEVPVRCYG